jgi:altronate dehydratase
MKNSEKFLDCKLERIILMKNKINALLISEKDGVAVALEELNEGDVGRYKAGEAIGEICIIQRIPIYHKFAVKNVKAGELVYKYGQVIGRATLDISPGQHVHSHNLISIREAIISGL